MPGRWSKLLLSDGHVTYDSVGSARDRLLAFLSVSGVLLVAKSINIPIRCTIVLETIRKANLPPNLRGSVRRSPGQKPSLPWI